MERKEFCTKYRWLFNDEITRFHLLADQGSMPAWNYLRAWLERGRLTITRGREASPCYPVVEYRNDPNCKCYTFLECVNRNDRQSPDYSAFERVSCPSAEADYFYNPEDPNQWCEAKEFFDEDYGDNWIPFCYGGYLVKPDFSEEVERCLNETYDHFFVSPFDLA